MAEWTWLVLFVLLPAAVNPFGQLAFEPLKASLLRAGAVVIGVAWLGHRLLRPAPRVDVRAHPVVRTGLALIGLTAISTVFSPEPALSFFGSFDRGMGWLSVAAGGVLLMAAADLFADERRRERAISALLLGSLVPCGYLLVQRVGLDPVSWTTQGVPGSSLGSPTFLGGYLVVIAPFAAYRVLSRARTGASLAYAGWLALLLVVSATILLTTIRGPIVGLAVGVVTFAVLARARRRPGRQELVGATALLFAAVALAVAVTGTTGVAGLQRFLNIARPLDSSGERLLVWREALLIPAGDPPRMLIGYGPETQSALLEHSEALVRYSQAEKWDRAHNLLLDTWLTGGLLGLVALIGVVAVVVRCAWRARASTPGDFLPAALIAALVGHLVEVAFAFHTVMTEALFWLMLGLVASLTPRLSADAATARPRLAILSALAGLILLPPMAAPAVADALYGAARRANYEVGARQEELAAAWAPWVEELPRVAALDWQQVANRRDDAEVKNAARARAEQDLVEAAARARREPVPQVRLTRWYLNMGDLEAAEAACLEALRLGPYRAAVWVACADVSVRRGLADEASIRRARGEELSEPL